LASQISKKISLVSAMDLVFFSPLELDFGDCEEFLKDFFGVLSVRIPGMSGESP
jgi:hypothetical protein